MRFTIFRAVSTVVLVTGLVAAILLCSKLLTKESAELRATTDANARRIALQVQTGVLAAIQPLERLGQWWLSQGKPADRGDWATDGQLFLTQSTGLRQAFWVDPSGWQRWSAVPGSVPATDRIRPNDRIQREITAAGRSKMSISGSFEAPGTGSAIYVCFPIRQAGRVRGYVVGLYETRALIAATAATSILREQEVTIASEGRRIYGSAPSHDGSEGNAVAQIPLANQVWRLELHVPMHYFREFRGLIVSVVGVVGALIYSFIVLLTVSQKWSTVLQKVNESLEKEVERRANAEAEARALNLELTRLQRAERMKSLGAMAAGIAHDFNNLLTSILGNASLAASSVPEGDPAREYIAASIESAKQAGSLVQKVLAYTGHAFQTVQPVDLDSTLRKLKPRLEMIASPKAAIHLAIAPQLPQILADPEATGQVLRNLISNAVEAMRPEGGVIEIRAARCELQGDEARTALADEDLQPGPYVRLEVKDSGPGMPPEVAERAFDPFFSTKFLGRGLGLSEVLGIMRAHGGAVRLESAPGGTSVQLYFPLPTA
jgi:signal transduction histidine kinase